MGMYIFGRVLRLRRLAALFSGVVYMFSGFLIVSVVFTMFLAAVPWLPLLLAIIETIIRKQEEKGVHSFRPIPYVAVGSIIVGLVVLAGHPELIYYTLLVAGAYAGFRLLAAYRTIRTHQQRLDEIPPAPASPAIDHSPVTPHPSPVTRHPSPVPRLLTLAGWLLIMVVLGVGLGAVQLLPLVELLPLNFRVGSASLEQVREWAWPTRQVLTFWLPNLFGNPSHHQWLDIWTRQWLPATANALGQTNHTIFWGVKNYVEGGNYLGIATWVLAAVAVLRAAWGVQEARGEGRGAKGETQGSSATESPVTYHLSGSTVRPFFTWFFAGLAVVSLLFAFGTPLYALLYYGLPGWNQLHSPFRWVFPFTLSMALLGGIGLNVLLAAVSPGARIAAPTPGHGDEAQDQPHRPTRCHRWPSHWLVFLSGLVALALVVVSLVSPGAFVAFGQRIVDGSDLAQMAFADGRMFWSYQAANVAAFGLFALLTGALDRLAGLAPGASAQPTARSTQHATRLPVVSLIALALILLTALDLYVAHGRFNPATDPALSPLSEQNTPPVVQFINAREAELAPRPSPLAPPWRFTTFNAPGAKTFNANVGMYYGWQDIRGYDSIIPRQYVDLMDRIQPQANELLYNRIAPLYAEQGGDVYAVLDNPLLDLLNVKYVLTEHYIPNPTWHEVYRDASVGVYENSEVMPRVFIVPEAQVAPAADQPLTTSDLRSVVFIEETPTDANALVRASPQLAEARISRYTANEVFVDVNLSDRGWLVLTDAFFPGWKAYLRPFGGDENQETELPLFRGDGAFRAVYLPQDGQWTVRFVYSPMSFKLGLYVSFLSAMTLLLLVLYWLWGRYYRPEIDADEVQRVAKNSLVPMGLSLFNKAIDFAFAMLYVRLLGPVGTGQYYFVVAIYGFFEIISRYGLGTLLTRDVAADKNQSSRYLTNVIALRTLLWAICMPLMALVVLGYRLLAALVPGAEVHGPARGPGPGALRLGHALRQLRRCASAACSSPSRRWSIPLG